MDSLLSSTASVSSWQSSVETSFTGADISQEILRDVCDMVCDYRDVSIACRGNPSQHKVIEFASPEEIASAFAEKGLDIDMISDSSSKSKQEILGACEETLRLSVRTGHPHFFNQLYGKVDPVGLAGDIIAGSTNTNCFTYEVAPVYTLVEKAVIKKFCHLVGGGFRDHGDGVFVPGGSIANLYGMHVGRFALFPEVKERGLAAVGPLVAFVSSACHYSYDKSCHVMGLGSSNLVKIPEDPSTGSMDIIILRREIIAAKDEGKVPYFVGCTLGTTVLGGFDDLVEIRKICDEHGLWMHVDGAWGGSAVVANIISESKSESLSTDDFKIATYLASCIRGIDAADSFCFNPHKMLGAPLQCSAFLLQDSDFSARRDARLGNSNSQDVTKLPCAGLLSLCNGTCAPYLFQADKNYGQLDIGDGTIQCSRRPDAFKIWLAWKALGDDGVLKRLIHGVELARYTADVIRKNNISCKGRFVLFRNQDPFYSNVCFWYIPSQMLSNYESLESDLEDLDPCHPFAQDLRRIAPSIKNELQHQGKALITFTGLHNFFRLVFASPIGVSTDDVDIVLNDIASAGEGSL